MRWDPDLLDELAIKREMKVSFIMLTAEEGKLVSIVTPFLIILL